MKVKLVAATLLAASAVALSSNAYAFSFNMTSGFTTPPPAAAQIAAVTSNSAPTGNVSANVVPGTPPAVTIPTIPAAIAQAINNAVVAAGTGTTTSLNPAGVEVTASR